MGEVHYMISEAEKRIAVNADKLEQWEDDFNLPIGRTEMGHRFYTEDDIQLLRCIKELKHQKINDTELKQLVPDLILTRQQIRLKKHLAEAEHTQTSRELKLEDHRTLASDDKEELLLLAKMMQELLEKNNVVLEEAVCSGVSEKVTKSIEFLLQAKERTEEERYRSLDHLIRQQQTARRESAKGTTLKRLFKILSAT